MIHVFLYASYNNSEGPHHKPRHKKLLHSQDQINDFNQTEYEKNNFFIEA